MKSQNLNSKTMKMNWLKITMPLVAVALLTSCKDENKGGQAESPSAEMVDSEEVAQEAASSDEALLAFNDPKVEAQFQHYIHLKTALVNSDLEDAKSGAAMLLEVSEQADLKELLAQIATADDIEVQRTAFSSVTEKMTALVESSLAEGEVYKQFCPMAFNNTGGYWLATEKEIRNPYFGDRMLTCGMVKETIN